MSVQTTPASEVFSAREVARAAGVSPADIRALVTAGSLRTLDGRFIPRVEAIRVVRQLSGLAVPPGTREIFSAPPAERRASGPALAASGAFHAFVFATIAFITTLGVSSAAKDATVVPEKLRMVFLAIPGPGGGGGGGGLRQPAPPPRAQLQGVSAVKSPVPPPRRLASRRVEPKVRTPPPPPVRPKPVERPVDPPPVAVSPEPMPQVVAPVATAAADPVDQPGVLTQPAANNPSNGPGSGGGTGTGQGTGMGEGGGSGIGPGSGGGTGGGPYRAGSGISAPAIVREVKPDYTEEARRRGVEGDVVLEIVVRRDGTVGNIRLLQGLGSGLDQRAVDAVRQWRFSPAMRQGTPVDVMVEVAVEFKLR
jgi:TonB family protein